MRMLMSFLAASFRAGKLCGRASSGGEARRRTTEPRGGAIARIALSHRDGCWLTSGECACGRSGANCQDFRRGDLPGDADTGLSARPLGGQETRRIDIERKLHHLDQWAWPGIATLPGLPRPPYPRLSPQGLPVGIRSSAPGWKSHAARNSRH